MVIQVGLNHPTPLDAIIIDQREDENIRKEYAITKGEELKKIVNNYENKTNLQKFYYNFLNIFETPDTLRRYRIAKKVLEERAKTN
jgi:hypothetical protein